MKKFLLGLISLSLVLTICVPFASAQGDELTIVENMIDYTVYGEDMVYIQEHADLVAQYNQNVLLKNSRATTYRAWSWDTGAYVETESNGGWLINPEYYFVPDNNVMYFSVDVRNVSEQPYIMLNTYNASTGTLTYIGSYNIDENSYVDNRYSWTRYTVPVTTNEKYVVGLTALSSWSYAQLKINNDALYSLRD